MKNLKISTPLFLMLNPKAGGKQLLAAFGFLLFSYFLMAQNASYNANSIPISGNYNSAFGAGAFNNTSTGIFNTATGLNALHNNTSGTHNTATGVQALLANTTGIWNTAAGVNSLVSNTSGSYNTATGIQSLYLNTTGVNNAAYGVNALYANTDGYNNTATGVNSLYLNTTGNFNTATGVNSLYANTYGVRNTAVGYYSLFSNNVGQDNTAIGTNALSANTNGSYNSAVGDGSLQNNTTGTNNAAIGENSLYYNTIGFDNTGLGAGSLLYNTSGNYNTAVGINALYQNITGISNTAIGNYAGTNSGNISYSTAIGVFSTNTASNQVRIGSSSTASIGGQVGWTTLSDARVKQDIQEKVPGLEFINKLRPVTYHLNMDAIAGFLKTPDEKRLRTEEAVKGKLLQTGLIAQEVEKAATDLGYDFSGVDKPKNEGDLYGLRYAELTIPLIKAIQELSKQNEAQQKELNDLRELIRKNSGTDGTININNSKVEGNLFQNAPNPFSQSTTIKYSIAANAQSAVITVVSLTGKKVKEFDLRSSNRQAVEINGGDLSAGTYIYSLIVDGRLVDTKRMILTE